MPGMIKAEVQWLQNDLTRLDYDARYAVAQRRQASITLQPDSFLFNSLGAGVVKLTV